MKPFVLRALLKPIIRMSWVTFLLAAQAGIASDAYIKADNNEIGQGLLRRRGGECLVITPLHVVDAAYAIQVTLADKRTLAAEMIESFPGDVSVLRFSSADSIPCRQGSFFTGPQLDALLGAEKQGEVRTMLADGSIRIIPVNIAGYDKFRSIHVVAQDADSRFTKGESGSPLYIAGRFAGILLSVKGNVGTVLRGDALAQTLALFFDERAGGPSTDGPSGGIDPTPDLQKKREKGAGGQEFSGVVAQSAVAQHAVRLEGNSPVRLGVLPSGDPLSFNIEILDSARRIVFRNDTKPISGSETLSVPFTPPVTDTYVIHIIGAKGEGRYGFSLTPITTNAQLRGAANMLDVGGSAVQGIIARGAVAEYRAHLEGNGPVRLSLPATDEEGRYSLDIVDQTGRSVYRDPNGQYSLAEAVTIPFTPPKSGSYTIRIKGTAGEGAYSLRLVPIASNAQLRGEANVLAVDGAPVEGAIAQGAVAEYRVRLEAVRPVRFHFTASGDQGRYTVEIVDSTGLAVYLNPSRRYSGLETFVIPFSAPKVDTYTLRMHGTEGECRYALSVRGGSRSVGQ